MYNNELPNSCLLANGSPTGCESCSPSDGASYCDLCGHWRDGVRKLDEDFWACAKCVQANHLDGVWELPYLVYSKSEDGEGLMSIALHKFRVVLSGNKRSHDIALANLLRHLNEWNRLSLGERTFFTDEQFEEQGNVHHEG